MTTIKSTNNEIIKHYRSLIQTKKRHELNEHVIEGEKLVSEAFASGIIVKKLFIEEHRDDLISSYKNYVPISLVSKTVLNYMSGAVTPQDICAIVETPSYCFDSIRDVSFVVALDTVQDPGNVGTIIRTSDALGVGGILIGEGCADPYSLKAIRASMGSAYHFPVIMCDDLKSSISELKSNGYQLICGHLEGTEAFPVLSNRIVCIIGNEGNGVSGDISDQCYLYKIPMKGKAESLNAAVAAALLIYQISLNHSS